MGKLPLIATVTVTEGGVCAIMITFVHGHLYVILIPLKVSFQNMEKQEH